MKSGLLRPERSGVYATPADLAPFQARAARGGLAWLTVDLAAAGEKAQFLAACARELAFPKTFGGNWDALADCLQDFSWRPAPGYVLHFANARMFVTRAPRDFAAAVEILADTAIYWKDRGKTFIALVDGVLSLPAAPPA